MTTLTTGITSTNCQFANLDELMVATNPETGNYVIQLYGNIYVHQKPGVELSTLIAYQTDTRGRLHFIAEICVEPQISQLSVSADGRYFAFITGDGQLTNAYVYFLDTLNNTMDIAYSWTYKYSTNSITPMLFFSVNGQFAVFSPCGEKIHVQSLYTPGHEVVFESPVGFLPAESPVGFLPAESPVGFLPAESTAHYLVVAHGSDYMVWLQHTGRLAVIDMISGQQPTQWPETNIWLNPMDSSSCLFYNDYIIHIHQPCDNSFAEITILALNIITETVAVVNQIKFPELGITWCVPDPDGKNIVLHNQHNHRDTQMPVLLPEITTHFHD